MNGTYVINGNVTRKLLPHTPTIIAEAEGVLFGANAATEGAEVFHVVRARADNIVNNKKRLLTDGASASPCSNDDSARQAARTADTGSPGTSTAAAAAAAPSSSPAKSRKGCTSPAGAAKSSGMRPAMRRKIASPRQRQVAKLSGAGAGSGDGNGGDSDDRNGSNSGNSGGGGSNVNGDGSTNPSGSSSPGERSSQNVSTSIRETMRGAGKGLFAAAAVPCGAVVGRYPGNTITMQAYHTKIANYAAKHAVNDNDAEAKMSEYILELTLCVPETDLESGQFETSPTINPPQPVCIIEPCT